MERVPLSVFVDFVMASGLPKLRVVKAWKDNRYNPACDFYRELREGLGDTLRERRGLASLGGLVAGLDDSRKRTHYAPLLDGFTLWHGEEFVWRAPPRTVLPIGDLEITIEPELGRWQDDREYLVALHYAAEPLTARRASILLALLAAALAPTRPKTIFGVLETFTGHLHTLTAGPNPRTGLLLRGEAASFATIYGCL